MPDQNNNNAGTRCNRAVIPSSQCFSTPSYHPFLEKTFKKNNLNEISSVKYTHLPPNRWSQINHSHITQELGITTSHNLTDNLFFLHPIFLSYLCIGPSWPAQSQVRPRLTSWERWDTGVVVMAGFSNSLIMLFDMK